MSLYEQAVKADPSDYDACEGLGVSAIKTEEFAAALESLHHALSLNPDSANARYDATQFPPLYTQNYYPSNSDGSMPNCSRSNLTPPQAATGSLALSTHG